MAITFDDYRNVRVNPAVVALAHDVAQVTAAMRANPAYPAYARNTDPVSAERGVVGHGLAAITDYLHAHPDAPLSEQKRSEGRLKSFNAVQGMFGHLSPGEIAPLALAAFDRLPKAEQVKVATADGSAAFNLLGDKVKAEADKARDPAKPKTGSDADNAPSSGGGKWVNGRWVLGADSAIGRWLGIANHDSGANSAGAIGTGRSGNGNGGPATGPISSNAYGSALAGNERYGPEQWTKPQMYGLAEQLNMSWAKGQPELMKLGPSALRAISEAGIKQDTYGKMTSPQEINFKAKDAVNLAKLAKETGQSGEDLARHTINTARAVEPTQAGRHEFGRHFAGYMDERKADPKAAAAHLHGWADNRYRSKPAALSKVNNLIGEYTRASKADAKATLQNKGDKQESATARHERGAAQNEHAAAKNERDTARSDAAAKLNKLNALAPKT